MMETHAQAQPIHPEVEKILGFEIPARKIRADLRPAEGDGILLADLIEPTDIRFDQRTGKPMMLHGGILSICDGIGVAFLPPAIEKTGEKEYQATVGIQLGDGSVFYATGEASNLNTDNRELSGKFPVNQTHIRALNKAVVRALGLYRVLLTEEEADEFKTPQVMKLQQGYEATLQEIVQKAQNKEERLVKVISGMMDFVALPASDSKYPHAYLADIKEDVDYLKELKKGENKIIAFVANQLLKEQQKTENADVSMNEATLHTEEKQETGDKERTIEEPIEVPISEEEQEAFLRELKEGQDILQQEIEQAEMETSATKLPASSVQLTIDEAGNVVEPT